MTYLKISFQLYKDFIITMLRISAIGQMINIMTVPKIPNLLSVISLNNMVEICIFE